MIDLGPDTVKVINIIGIVLFFLILLVWLMVHLWRSPPTNSWSEFSDQLEEDRRWWACQEGPGCDWPEHCSPGECRRPRGAGDEEQV